jgi:hypothetical protein
MRALIALPFVLAACPDINQVDPPPPTAPACTPTDAPSQWLIGSASGPTPNLTVTLTLQTFAVSGVELADFFRVDGGTLSNTQFDAASLASSSSVTLTVVPNAGATTVTIHTGATCKGTAKAIDAAVDLASLSVTISPH